MKYTIKEFEAIFKMIESEDKDEVERGIYFMEKADLSNLEEWHVALIEEWLNVKSIGPYDPIYTRMNQAIEGVPTVSEELTLNRLDFKKKIGTIIADQYALQ